MYRGSRHLGTITGPIPRPLVPTPAARVRNAIVGARASGGQSWNVQSGRYNPLGFRSVIHAQAALRLDTFETNTLYVAIERCMLQVKQTQRINLGKRATEV
jgi:hypothetical protein